MRSAIRRRFSLFLPEQVVAEARRHLPGRKQTDALDSFLSESRYEELPMPSVERVRENLDLVRSEKDVPIALALLDGQVEVLVTNDRDFTDPLATAERFRDHILPMLPPVFLREVLGWPSEALESIRHRTWADFKDE
jgi:hypothetical protein